MVLVNCKIIIGLSLLLAGFLFFCFKPGDILLFIYKQFHEKKEISDELISMSTLSSFCVPILWSKKS